MLTRFLSLVLLTVRAMRTCKCFGGVAVLAVVDNDYVSAACA